MHTFSKKYLFGFFVCLAVASMIIQPVLAAYPYAAGGIGTVIITGGNKIFIVVRMELWGDGVWKDPTLASRWEQTIEAVWNNDASGSPVKYKCYEVEVDVVMIVSPEGRQSPEGGTPDYHQIWVPDVSAGDMANTYNQYGLYLPEQDSHDVAYGEYDSTSAQQYYESNATEDQRASGKGKVSGFIWNPSAIGADAEKKATWGTFPNTLSDSVVTHEFGHLMGVSHDQKGCTDNVMSPSNGKDKVRTQVYPRYYKEMLEPLNLMCEWDVQTDIHMDATAVGTYFPPKIDAHNRFTLKEEKAARGFIASTTGISDFIYDYIEPNFTCNVFTWEPHNGKIDYRAEILYNFKEDLKTGGRIFLTPAIMQEPYEEIKGITGCGSGPLESLSMVNPVNHHNLLYSLTGKNLEVTPYDYHTDDPASCPAKEEEPLIEKYYIDGVVIDGAKNESKAEHFPNADLFGALFNYNIRILKAEPLASSVNSASGETASSNQTSKENNTFGSSTVEEILQQRSNTLGESTPSQSSASSKSVEEKEVVDMVDSMTDNNLSKYTGDDGMIEQNAKYLQQLLWASFFGDASYPDSLDTLDLTGVDLKGITYTPKGSEPFTDYEMRVEFSTIIEI